MLTNFVGFLSTVDAWQMLTNFVGFLSTVDAWQICCTVSPIAKERLV